tara:strand:- start:224 stop:532 length:309 start_codon:yes stop_codon:yes gene_type:complete
VLTRQATFALCALARQLTGAANSFCFFASAFHRWFLEVTPKFHFAEDTFTLHFLLQRFESLINVIVANEYLHELSLPFSNLPINRLNLGCASWTWSRTVSNP